MSSHSLVRAGDYRPRVAVTTATAPAEPRTSSRGLSRILAQEGAIGWGLVGLGSVLRVVRYLHDRSLWGDEARLALNLRDHGFGGLLHQLDYIQAAPTGFLLLEKAAVALFGDSEYALRLVPLAAGIASLALFLPLARRLLSRRAALVAVSLYALAEPLIYYSSEVKQYSVDALATIVLLLIAAPALLERTLSRRRALALLAAGAIAFWFSHPSVFVAGAIWLSLAAMRVRMPKPGLAALGILGAVWLAVFGASYALVVRNAKGVSDALGLGSSSSHYSPVDVLRDGWHAFAYPVGFAYTATALAAALTVFGAFTLLRRSPAAFAPLVLTVALAVLASLVGRYPFYDRFILFLVPIVLLVVAAGLDPLLESPSASGRAGFVVAFTLLAAYPFGQAIRHLESAPPHEEIKPVIAHVADSWRPGDVLYVSNVAQYALRYYAECTDCGVLDRSSRAGFRNAVLAARGGPTALHSLPRLEVGRVDAGTPLSTYVTDFQQLRGHRRVWLLFTSTFDVTDLQLALGCTGRLLDTVTATRAAAYLYDLAAPPDASPADCPGATPAG